MEKLADLAPVLLFVMAIASIAIAILRRKPAAGAPSAEDQERLRLEALPKCDCCGALATHPLPRLRRSRGSVLRKVFAAPPSYRRVVEPLDKPALCEAHAHTADALLDEFIFGIRQKYAALNATIASSAAGFEQEALLFALRESLTEKQKRAQRVPLAVSPIRAVPKTGTDDTSS